MRKTKRVSLALISILIIALFFTPTQIVHAGSTEVVIENISIDWIVNQTNYKKAIFHAATNKGSYDFLLEGNTTQTESETNIRINVYVPQEDTFIYAQSINTSTPDILTDAPYTGASVDALHIQIEPSDAKLLYAFAKIVAIALVINLLIIIIQAIGGVFSPQLAHILDTIFYASIPWVYVTIYDNDKEVDGSLDLYIPYDSYNAYTLVASGRFYLATAKSWWLIEKVTEEIAIWTPWGKIVIGTIVYYVPMWKKIRVPPSPPSFPPHASFFWAPDIVGPGQNVTFLSTSYDPDGEIQSWHWWFGDGSEAYGQTVIHAYSHVGRYNVRLEVTDNQGLKGETSTSMMGISFNVVPEAPLGTISLSLAMIGVLGLFMAIRSLWFKRFHPRFRPQ